MLLAMTTAEMCFLVIFLLLLIGGILSLVAFSIRQSKEERAAKQLELNQREEERRISNLPVNRRRKLEKDLAVWKLSIADMEEELERLRALELSNQE